MHKNLIENLIKKYTRSLVSRFSWIGLVVNRFARVDRRGRSAVTSALATVGICFGVMTLIVVVSVMNGFQMGFKDAIMELSSYHIRVSNISEGDEAALGDILKKEKDVVSVTPFYEAQGLMAGNYGEQNAAVIRAVPVNVCDTDKGFAREIKVVAGKFDLTESGSIVLGASLASSLSVRVGGTVNLLALSGGSDVQLFSQNRNYTVKGIFRSAYSDINSGYAFINFDDGLREFGRGAELISGIKIRHANSVRSMKHLKNQIISHFADAEVESWQSYNRSFFGVLRVEKNMLMLFVFLIFVVVSINIYNGMNRLVFERQTEISVFAALGATKNEIKTIFVARGFLTGAAGAGGGILLGLLLSANSGAVFRLVSGAMYWVQYFFMMIVNPSSAAFLRENPMYYIYASIPARIIPHEVFLITLFGFFAPLAASCLASRKVLSMTVAEVLHDE